MAARLTVGELSARTSVSRKALRVYEAAGILTPLTRTPSGYRIYGSEAVQVVAFIAQARRLGFSVAEIRQIVGLRQAGNDRASTSSGSLGKRSRRSTPCSAI